MLVTKLYAPPPRASVVLRPRLIEQLNAGLQRKLTLISAPAGFGKTTLVSEWMANHKRPVAWLSLDEKDSDPTRFLAYLVAALRTIMADLGEGIVSALQSPQPPPLEAILTSLLNEITGIPEQFILVLDDYHVIDAEPVDTALTFLLKHLPAQMHLVIATREDPQLPLARLRAQGQLTELRVADLRFTSSEAAGFLNQVMGLDLSAIDIAALETRTEGWIAGLQLAAISMQGHKDATSFIRSFTGSHHFVMDYLVEEVLQQQPASVQTFLLHTAILDRLCGPLCDAVLRNLAPSGAETLAYLEHANMFIIPLDNERHWYRYHHLFADLLRQRLHQTVAASSADAGNSLAEYHIRASIWYEENNLKLEAFQHAAAANDIERAIRLIEENGLPLTSRVGVMPVLNWLASLPTTVLDARPVLWVRYASLALVIGQTIGVEQRLQAAETALQGVELDEKTRDLIGQIAAARATLALSQYQIETIIVQAHRALEYLRPDSLGSRTTAIWTLGYAHQFRGDRVAASRAYSEAISISQTSGNIFVHLLATIGLGNIQEADNQLALAAQTYQRVLRLFGDHPQSIAYEAYIGLARIYYEWNDLDAALQHGQRSVQLARQYEHVIDRFIICELFLVRLKLTQGDLASAAVLLAEVAQSVRQHNFVYRIPEVAAAQVLLLLQQGDLASAAQLAQMHEIPMSQTRVYLAQGNASAALTLLEPLRTQTEEKGWQDERLKVMVLQAIALHIQGEQNQALQLLGDALFLAESAGFIRTFVDEGIPMKRLLSEAAERGMLPDYIGRLLAAFESERQNSAKNVYRPTERTLIEPLSQRELEVLQLITQGLSNQDISTRLFLALSTVKGHNQRIFAKLDVQSRTEAIARARELGLL